MNKMTVTTDIGQGGLLNLIEIKRKKEKDLDQEISSIDKLIIIKEVNIKQVITIMRRGEDREAEIIIGVRSIDIKIGRDLRVERGEEKEANQVAHLPLLCILIE